MKPSLALLLSTIGVFGLLWIDSDRRSRPSLSLWIPSIWVLIIGSRMVSLWLASASASATSQSYEDGSPIDAVIFALLTLGAIVTVVQRRPRWSELLTNNAALFIFLGYAALSILWSDFPIVSIKRYVKEIGNLFAVLVVLTEKDRVAAIRTVAHRCAIVLIPYSIILYKYFSELGRGYDRWTGTLIVVGVTNNKNSLGVLCALSALALCWTFLVMRKRGELGANRLKVIVIITVLWMTIWMLMMANSATSSVCLGLGLFILIAATFDAIRRHFAPWMLAGIVVAAAMYMAVDVAPAMTNALGRDQTLTGRTEVWEKVLAIGTDPIFGDGYSSFWLGERLETLWAQYQWQPTEAHNGYLEIYLDLGLIGDFLLLGVILSSFRTAFRDLAADYSYGVFRLAILSIAAFYNITESAFRPGLLMYFFFLVAAVQLPAPVAVPIPVDRRTTNIAKLSQTRWRWPSPKQRGQASHCLPVGRLSNLRGRF
jgi:O-antigen ligase